MMTNKNIWTIVFILWLFTLLFIVSKTFLNESLEVKAAKESLLTLKDDPRVFVQNYTPTLSTTEIKEDIKAKEVIPANITNFNNRWKSNVISVYNKYENLQNELYRSYLPVKVLLSTPKDFTYFDLLSNNNLITSINGNKVWESTRVKVQKKDNKIVVTINWKEQVYWIDTSVQILATKREQVTEVVGWNRFQAWDKKQEYNDNKFLGSFDIRFTDNFLNLVNELDLSDYMRWVAEVPEKDEDEKRKVLAVISRSYILYYSILGNDEKFPGKHYNASDDPKIYQKYLGYSFTLRSPKWQQTLKDTEGEILTYKDKVLRAAYFSCTKSTMKRTLTPEEAGWTGKYFDEVKEVYQSIEDSVGVDPNRTWHEACGHGVGLSWYGSTQLAKQGKKYDEILKHYYQKIKIDNYLK